MTSVSALEQSLTGIAQVARGAGFDPAAARDEGLRVAAALAESAPGAPSEWIEAAAPGTSGLAAVNRMFFDAAVRGRRWREHPTALLSALVAARHPAAQDYASALTEVAAAACTLGEPSITVTANAAAASAAYLGATHGPARPGGVPSAPAPTFPAPDLGSARPTGLLPQLPAGPGTDAVLRSWGLGPQPQPTGPVADTPSELSGIPNRMDPAATQADPTSEPAAEAPGEPAEPERTVEELLAELDAMIGLHRVKKEVHRQVALLTVEKLRVEAGLKQNRLSRHLIFVGNPGTGKTTVARLVGSIYKALELLDEGQLVEVDRSELVAGYVGQTAIKTAEVCARAVGGVLFIDEAYSLTGDQYAQEAVGTLVKEMEDHREDLVLIVAGYPDPMAGFIASNPGLASRFTTTIEFDDYSDDELLAILVSIATAADYELTEDAERRVRQTFEATPRTPAFGNGRFARNLFEAAVARHAWRLKDVIAPTRDELRLLIADDFTEHPDPTPPAEEPATDESPSPAQGPSPDQGPSPVPAGDQGPVRATPDGGGASDPAGSSTTTATEDEG
ncbi:MAG: AAA family ATPase [Intrasporangium sp.]|uniref:AAA family ATPase n=1 Tax=Intrasporangium sp. TaxID=1925024 RepID=UPI00264802B9|nr:AAA family ATPase [Intrasporangium sp.]MDN5795913.1 AAA family ATPase [Intrasporangium sp.]